jgi:hypothetical protein
MALNQLGDYFASLPHQNIHTNLTKERGPGGPRSFVVIPDASW